MVFRYVGSIFELHKSYTSQCGSGSVVGIATGYGLDGPRIEPRWGRDFPYMSRPALGPTQTPIQWVPGLSRGVKSGRGVTLTPHPPSSAVGHKRVELYLYSPYWPYGLYRASVPVQGCTLALSLPFHSNVRKLQRKQLHDSVYWPHSKNVQIFSRTQVSGKNTDNVMQSRSMYSVSCC